MNYEQEYKDLLEIFKVLTEYELPLSDELYFSTNEDKIRVYAMVNDVFWWACADLEEITVDNLPILKEAIKEIDEATSKFRYIDDGIWAELYAAKVRKLRPQGACYPKDTRLWPLFNKCGPEREPGFGNPYNPGEYKPTNGTVSPKG